VPRLAASLVLDASFFFRTAIFVAFPARAAAFFAAVLFNGTSFGLRAPSCRPLRLG
jgi:hypothetical protein